MKSLVVLASLVSVSAFAQSRPLIVKGSGSGFVHPDWARSVVCEVYENKVVITKQYGAGRDGGVTLNEERKISFGGSISKLIENAAKEEVEHKDNGLCDAPGSATHANLISGSTVTEIELYSTGGCGTPSANRVGPFSSALRDMVATYCPGF